MPAATRLEDGYLAIVYPAGAHQRSIRSAASLIAEEELRALISVFRRSKAQLTANLESTGGAAEVVRRGESRPCGGPVDKGAQWSAPRSEPATGGFDPTYFGASRLTSFAALSSRSP